MRKVKFTLRKTLIMYMAEVIFRHSGIAVNLQLLSSTNLFYRQLVVIYTNRYTLAFWVVFLGN